MEYVCIYIYTYIHAIVSYSGYMCAIVSNKTCIYVYNNFSSSVVGQQALSTFHAWISSARGSKLLYICMSHDIHNHYRPFGV